MIARLTEVEKQVLRGLILKPEARPADKTVEAVAVRTGLSHESVQRTLVRLEALEPAVVHREVDARLGIEFWMVLVPGAEALEHAE